MGALYRLLALFCLRSTLNSRANSSGLREDDRRVIDNRYIAARGAFAGAACEGGWRAVAARKGGA